MTEPKFLEEDFESCRTLQALRCDDEMTGKLSRRTAQDPLMQKMGKFSLSQCCVQSCFHRPRFEIWTVAQIKTLYRQAQVWPGTLKEHCSRLRCHILQDDPTVQYSAPTRSSSSGPSAGIIHSGMPSSFPIYLLKSCRSRRLFRHASSAKSFALPEPPLPFLSLAYLLSEAFYRLYRGSAWPSSAVMNCLSSIRAKCTGQPW